ncbi:MAG: MFS transporter [Lachnospiraceae bacterium]|nr:MFS transporter [Lachnospiraceae bacterium]
MAKKTKDYATSKKERLSFALYSFGTICSYYLIYSFLQIFLTDAVGISAAAVSIIFIIAKVFDAVNDPIFGVLVDKFRFKDSKYRGWLKIAAFAVPVTTVLVFLNPTSGNFPIGGRIAWALISYVLWDCAYTMCDAPAHSLVVVASKTPDERNHILALNSFMVYFGGLLIVVLVPILRPMAGWGMTGIVIGVLSFLGMILIPFTVKERFNVPQEKEVPISTILRTVAKNRYLLIIVLVQILGSLTDFATTLQTYFATYCLGSETWLTALALATVFPVLLVVMFVPKLLEKVDNFKAYVVTRIMTIVITVLIYVCGYENIVVMISLVALRAAVSAVWSLVSTIFIADCIEYGEFTTGERNQGVAFSLKAFVNKMVVALAGALGMACLAAIGYVENGVAQTPQVIHGIWVLYSLAPAAGTVIALAVLLLFYPLRDRDVKAMTAVNRGEMTKEEALEQISKKVKL